MNENIEKLLLKYRLFYYERDQDGVNRLFGLKNLIEDNITSNMIGCEIGCFAGVSSELFANYCKKLFCVDQWLDYQIEGESSDGIMPAHYLPEAESRFDEMKSRYNNIIKIKKSSENASKTFKNNYFDFIYIDAAHDYINVKKDITLWMPKIKEHGIISGHDYSLIESVKKAVDEFFNIKEIKVYEDSSWCVKLK